MRLSAIVNASALLLIIVANCTPVLCGWLLRARWSRPIDGGVTWTDGRPLLGEHKTWRGLISGVLACALTALLLSLGFMLGALCGLATLAADLLSSFTKRRLGRRSGRFTPLIDQLPEALLPLLLLRVPLGLTALSIIGTASAFTLLDLAASWLMDGGRVDAQQF